MNYLKKIIYNNKCEMLYFFFLILLTIGTNNNFFILFVKLIISFSIFILIYFLKLKFKIFNTLLLTFVTVFVSSSLFDGISNNGILVILKTLLLYFALVFNIFSVTRVLYQRNVDAKRNYNSLKLLYVIFSFLLLIGTVVLSYSYIYENIWISDTNAFAFTPYNTFLPLYYSSSTYFTVGYGDIIPVSNTARVVSISQMFFSYLITCLILPSVLVAFQKLFQDQKDR